jgi:hypothetical protein
MPAHYVAYEQSAENQRIAKVRSSILLDVMAPNVLKPSAFTGHRPFRVNHEPATVRSGLIESLGRLDP